MDRRILSEIWIYPVKSLGGIRVASARVMEKGLQQDRRWMLIDDKNVCMTQRMYPGMSLFTMKFSGEEFQIKHGKESIQLPVSSFAGGPFVKARVWNDLVDVVEVPGDCSRWFSEHLKSACRLVAFPEQNSRPVNPIYSLNNGHVSLADGYPVLIIGQASLDDLNQRLQSPVPMNRFRPNLVFQGGQPYEEDSWKTFSVGSNRFAGVKPCSRCTLTTINQETGEKGHEPLLTLSRYRMKEENIYFGENAIPIDYNEIHEGDTITLH